MGGSTIFYVIMIISVIMVNPPVVYWFNDYCVANPLTCGWPTMFLWLEFWYTVMVIDFLICAWKLPAWDCHQDNKEIVPVERKMD